MVDARCRISEAFHGFYTRVNGVMEGVEDDLALLGLGGIQSGRSCFGQGEILIL